MKLDSWTKWILIAIALLLAVIAVRPIIAPSPVQAQSTAGFGAVQFTGIAGMSGFWAFDTKTGDVWTYSNSGQWNYHGRLTKLGQPLAK